MNRILPPPYSKGSNKEYMVYHLFHLKGYNYIHLVQLSEIFTSKAMYIPQRR